ncbi:hypothetical protein SAMN05216553_104146 [Lentzea fradiae]|uniref:ABC-2 family transporter protein n=1 Tax=Lentzea fradiae TaxID=200378 RepID=A0A1G7PYE9_9PSEU|nr:hypothetical protein [Lentzea fradiae]SDF91347.1 hypothetical protein SAMN05216553_104146 [Lentzea fradiae]
MNLESIVWLTWRQHRGPVIGLAVLALGTVYALFAGEAGDGPAGSLQMAGFYAVAVQLAFGGVAGVVLGAPLVARELEERTYFVAWGQDVTALEWLRGKMIALGLLVVLLGAAVGAGSGFTGGQSSTWRAFEANSFVQAGYAAFGFALGVAIGLLTRHVATAMAATVIAYTLVRTVISFLRDYYWPAERDIARWEESPKVAPGSLEMGSGFVGEDLKPVGVPDVCAAQSNVASCMRSARAASGTYVDYQPPSRVGAFQFVEFSLYALLTVALVVLTFRALSRGGGWKPTRSHRRLPVPAVAETAAAEPAAESAVEAGGAGEAQPAPGVDGADDPVSRS